MPAGQELQSEREADRPRDGRARVLAAAATEFCQRGYSGASIAAIACRADVSKSTVFHYFDSKEALYLAVIEDAALAFRQTLDEVLANSADTAEALAGFQRSHLRHLQENRQVARLVLRELQRENLSEQMLARISKVLSENFARLLEFLERAAGRGELRAEADREVATLLLVAANVFMFQNRDALARLPDLDLDISPERYARAVSDIVFRGLEADPTESN
ncbi:MAG: TetR/AcrR family transcriptional regulator [Wenzhouxiangella sp.]